VDPELDNPFIEDGVYCLHRASAALQRKMDRDRFYDAAIYYAFGVEKLCKAIVHNVNPVFLLETTSFEAAAWSIYRDRLTEVAKLKLQKVERTEKSTSRLLPFQPTLLRAAKFSQLIEDHLGRFLELAEIRGALAHRSWAERDMERDCDFMLRTFASTADLFASELSFESDHCFEDDKKRDWLRAISKSLLAQENYSEFVKDILARHLAIWNERKESPSDLLEAASKTEARLKLIDGGGPYPAKGVCPCCGQPAVLYYRFIDRYGLNEVTTVGTYAVGLGCYFCDIFLSGYRAVDHFKLNDQGFGPSRWVSIFKCE
jgi:hypothetical protein